MGPDNPVRTIDAYVDELDLADFGFARTTANSSGAGQPAFPPAALLKLYLYGYLNRVCSSRGWRRNVSATWR